MCNLFYYLFCCCCCKDEDPPTKPYENPGLELNELKKITCNVKLPPATAKLIHVKILEKLASTVRENGYELKTDGEGPTLVTVVHSANLSEDISRDMAAAKLTDLERKKVILLRIQ